MFNHHQQHLRQLQHLFQQQQPPPPHHQHHHQGGRPMQPPRQPPPPRMMNLCSASQAAFLSTNPMLQGALLMQQMQGNLRGFAINGQQYQQFQQFQQFFPAGAGPSLLGPAPMGVSMKTPRMGFPSHHYHPHNRNFSKDFARAHDRKREMDLRIQARASDARQEGSAEGEQSERAANPDERAADPESQAEPSTEHQEEPAFKKQRLESSEEQMGEQCVSDEQHAQNAEEKTSREEGERDSGVAAECILTEDGVNAAGSEAMEFAEVLSAGGSLKVTIQQSSESRAISTSAPESAVRNSDTDAEAASKYYCYICNITCYNQQNFQSHMNGLAHQQRMMEIQHMSNACLVTLLPKVKESLQGQSQSKTDGENRHALQRWCTTCQVYFTGDLIEHRRTKEHKLSKHSSRPFCTVCKCHFRTPRKFVEHMKSPEHKHKVEELRSEAREHGGPENPEELITVDAIGCFEGEEDYEEDPSEEEEEEEESSMETLRAKSRQREVMLEELTEDEQYDSETQYGSSFVVPVAGFLCRLCHKFYHFESTARLSHCKSLMHFQNLQKYRAFRSLEAAEAQESGTIVEEHPDDTLQVAGQELGAETGVNLMEMGPADFSGTNREQGYGTTNSDSMPSDRTGSESPNPVKIVFDSPDPVKSGTDSTNTVKTISKKPSPGTASLYGLSQTKNSLLLDDLEEDAALGEQALDLSSSSNDCISKEAEVLEEQMDRNPEQRKGIPQTEGPVQEQDEDNVEGEQDRPQAEVEEEGETEEPGNMRSKGSSAEKEGEVEGSERPAGWQPCGAGANAGKRRSTRTRRSR
ncbi:cip1-interacting zinc finger protein-like [Acipenser ruthenus]|uniref:cip1-interacting zinc finger protein-like n=1 Tax=Acipenser ruthenus TaxID=7906 RepID=UPI00274201B0|nr:cip1-interacting zinc finger protein-like [Acipenser ruthenus]XP_058843100.1 cip1-interacting zinc finger protein-like [Acipenser ruthenus]XP_058843101.1 cip1-interacting zinc finger protein-like [Acipenser ruthenus]